MGMIAETRALADHQDYWQKKRERNIKHSQKVTAIFEVHG